MNNRIPMAGSDVSHRLSILIGFLSCMDASMNIWSQRGFSHGAENSNTCLAELVQAPSRELKICHTRGIPKGTGPNGPSPWGIGEAQSFRNNVNK